jgi:hypothetical protein
MADKQLIHGDRRIDRRYTFELPVLFSYRQGGVFVSDSGTTEELSGGGIRFVSDYPPPVGVEIELRVEWPFLLQNVCPLELTVKGEVLRSGARETVVRTIGYEFRTKGARSFDQAAVAASICDFVA